MDRPSSHGWAAFAFGALLMFACDGETPPDAGEEVDAGQQDGGGDAGIVDDAPPTVTSTRPRNGDALVGRTAELSIRFSEAVSATSGTVTATGPAGAIELGERAFTSQGDVLTIGPASEWPGGARVDVRVEGFVDGAGNVQAVDHDFVFNTSDEGSPEVVAVDPVEGATDVAVTPLTVSIQFSEPMNPLLGDLSLTGGAGTLGEATWSSEMELRVEITGLANGASYRVALSGFEDRNANLLDPAPVLVDGAIDFTTIADTTAPTVVDSNPTTGQLDLDVSTLRTLEVTFSEPMDRSLRTAPFSAGGTTGTLTGNWSPDGTVLRFDVASRAVIDAEHRLDLSAMRDAAGVTLDGSVSLDDGALVFTTSGADPLVPFVVFSSPSEGSPDVSTRLSEMRLLFSEAMDTATTSVALFDGTSTATLDGTWNAAGTQLTVALAGLAPRTAYQVDLGGFVDVSGNPVDDVHPYLVDGVLDFATGQPTGESCSDALTVLEATADGGAYEWTLLPGQFVVADGQPSCSSTSGIRDGVVAYEKTSGDLASGGSALRIRASTEDALNGLQLEIFRDVCDPADVGGGDAARQACLTTRQSWDQYLDVPAGTYYVWVGSERAEFAGVVVRIEEVAAIPEGESCAAPYTSASSIHTSPGADEHVWVVPHGAAQSSDFGTSTSGEGSIDCDTAHGPDSVIRVDKVRAGSILDVEVDPFPADTGTDIFDHAGSVVEALSACDSRDPATEMLACPGRINRSEHFQLAGDAGDYWLWLASNNSEVNNVQTTVRVREIDTTLGQTCADAFPLTAGASVSVSPDSSAAYFAPSCVPVDTGVTWYRYTTTRELSVVSLTGSAALAMVDASSGAELGCIDDGDGLGIPRRAPVGTEVCIAVPTSAAITAITIQEADWQGVDGGSVIDLGITRPVDGAGAELSITSEAWLEVTPTQLYMGVNVTSSTTAAVVSAPRVGGGAADRVLVDRFAIGNGGAAVGEALFTVDDTNASTRPMRLFRLVDPSGAPGATAWDTGSAYVARDIDCLARVAGRDELVMVTDSTTTADSVFYSASTTSPGPVTMVGASAHLKDVVAVAANDTWIFVGATYDGERGVYRVPWSNVGAIPQPLASPDLVSFSTSNGAMVYDPTRDILYFRSTSTPVSVQAVFDAGGAEPLHAGAVAVLGRSSDFGIAIDAAIPALFVFESETVTTGTFREIR